jgi:virulence factor Mce-like protein
VTAVMRRIAAVVLDRPWLLIGAAAVVAFALWAVDTRRQPHELKAAFAAGLSLSPGLDVQVDGVDVGKITSVDYVDGQALVGLGIRDATVWPLHRGTTAEIRFGTTVGNGTRTVQLHPGPASAPAIPDGGALGLKDTVSPVELDQFFDTMDKPTRASLQQALGGTADALAGGRGARLGEGIAASGGGLDAVGGVLHDLALEHDALARLLVNADRATQTLDARRPVIADLLGVAATTFDAFARNTEGVRDAIAGLPGTLRETRSTFARVNRSVPGLDALVRDVAPGAKALRTLAPAAVPAVRELRATAALGDGVLRSATAHAPTVTRLLDKGGPFLAKAGGVAQDLAPAVACVRPYAPEIAGFLSTWTGWAQNYDATGHYARTQILQGPTSVNSSPLTSAQLVATIPGLKYAMPRPPGLNEGQPLFLPECGAGPDALDPAKDPEARR